jgi:RNA polymerase sigma-70 factor (ECF subfamily)
MIFYPFKKKGTFWGVRRPMGEEVNLVDFGFLGAISAGLNKEQVLTDLMSEYGKDVWKYALFLTLDPNLADDIMQEVFIKVYEKMYSFRGQAAVKTWLFTITRNVARDHWKSAWSRKIILFGSRPSRVILPSAEQEVLSQLQEQDIWRYVLELPTKLREILLLHIHHELSLTDLAAILHISEGTVKSRLHRARGS